MSEVQLVIRDARREIGNIRHGSFAERVIAALSAEPETIEELDLAVQRFEVPVGKDHFGSFSPDPEYEPYDAGLVVVDLAARLVVCDSTYCSPSHSGCVVYHDGTRATDVQVRYQLSNDWLLAHPATDWAALAEERSRQRLANPGLDARAVLYGEPLLRFVAERCLDTFGGESGAESAAPGAAEMEASPMSPPGALEQGGEGDRPDYANPAYQRDYDLLRKIHADWLLTPREELRGQTPRQIMISKRRFVDLNLQYREHQWSSSGHCPPGLHPGSGAYRLAGFGTHETVVYYNLVRELLWSCRREVAKRAVGANATGLKRDDFLTGEVSRLARRREEWLDAPYSDSGHRTARRIIHNERSQIPEAEGDCQASIDHDCPLCEAEEVGLFEGPMFWHLDGPHMDDEFAFSTHETYEEWEQERHRLDDFNRRFNATWAEKERLGVKSPRGGYTDPNLLWKMSLSKAHAEEDPLPTRLFIVGSELSELIVDLREPAPAAGAEQPTPSAAATTACGELIERLTHAFQRLGDAVRWAEVEKVHEIIRFVLVDFRDALDAVRAVRPDLGIKSVELRDRLQRFLEPPSENIDPYEDLFGDDCAPS